ncbi:kinase-like domain-containing protein [Scheffersomyces xylosifermentans]|uniref:kinase-like domain-containing protein n=1 Tax=Scheffersomyces xylosifermentans TaxID=1304137 RepID=UPI00315D773D
MSMPSTVPSAAMAKKRSARDYQFGTRIGEGSYSTVFSALDIHTNKTYAIKVLSKRHIVKEDKIKYVNIEKTTLHRLGQQHPGIVQLYYTFQDESSLFFVLDFAEYGELLSIIRKFGSLSEPVSKYYMCQILDAVKFIHSKGVIHRDLKPENILVAHDFSLKITDFGAAKLLGGNDDSNDEKIDYNGLGEVTPTVSEKDRKGSFVGTAEYVSPELLKHNMCGFEADVWALGCILYQFFNGVPPFKGATEYLTFEKIINVEYSYRSKYPLPQDVIQLIDKILVAEPSQRLTIPQIMSSRWFQEVPWDDLKYIWHRKVPRFEPYGPNNNPVVSPIVPNFKTGSNRNMNKSSSFQQLHTQIQQSDFAFIPSIGTKKSYSPATRLKKTMMGPQIPSQQQYAQPHQSPQLQQQFQPSPQQQQQQQHFQQHQQHIQQQGNYSQQPSPQQNMSQNFQPSQQQRQISQQQQYQQHIQQQQYQQQQIQQQQLHIQQQQQQTSQGFILRPPKASQQQQPRQNGTPPQSSGQQKAVSSPSEAIQTIGIVAPSPPMTHSSGSSSPTGSTKSNDSPRQLSNLRANTAFSKMSSPKQTPSSNTITTPSPSTQATSENLQINLNGSSTVKKSATVTSNGKSTTTGTQAKSFITAAAAAAAGGGGKKTSPTSSNGLSPAPMFNYVPNTKVLVDEAKAKVTGKQTKKPDDKNVIKFKEISNLLSPNEKILKLDTILKSELSNKKLNRKPAEQLDNTLIDGLISEYSSELERTATPVITVITNLARVFFVTANLNVMLVDLKANQGGDYSMYDYEFESMAIDDDEPSSGAEGEDVYGYLILELIREGGDLIFLKRISDFDRLSLTDPIKVVDQSGDEVKLGKNYGWIDCLLMAKDMVSREKSSPKPTTTATSTKDKSPLKERASTASSLSSISTTASTRSAAPTKQAKAAAAAVKFRKMPISQNDSTSTKPMPLATQAKKPMSKFAYAAAAAAHK